MPRRIVYSPRVWVYTKDAGGQIFDLTNYVVSGNVSRRIDAVSTATVTLRNPNKFFTSSANQGAAFHPMDPITIFMQRLQSHPVRVFTGYLDKTPYYQMFPGTITLEASCTLKSLLYQYFDPALPYVNSFLAHYGWTNLGNGSIVANQAYTAGAGSAALTGGAANQKLFGNDKLNDGSISRLLHAVLTQIGSWEDNRIYIESIPDAVPHRMAALMREFQLSNDETQKEFSTFMKTFIGGSQGSGGNSSTGSSASGTPSGDVKGLDKIIPEMIKVSNQNNIPPELVITTALMETDFDQQKIHSHNSANAIGWFQFTSSTPYPTANLGPDWVKIAEDLGQSTDIFCKAALKRASDDPSYKKDLRRWAEDTQQPGGGAYAVRWPTELARAQQYISKYDTSSLNLGAISDSSANATFGTAAQATQTGATGNTPSSKDSGQKVYHTPFERVKNLTLERTDQGVDFNTGKAGDEIVAIGDGVCMGIIPEWYGPGQPLMWYKLTNGDFAGKYIYYAEGIIPKVKAGDTFTGGAVIAVTTDQPHGLEFGFAQADGQVLTPALTADHNNTPGGLMFARFLRSIGQNTHDPPGPGPGASKSGGATGLGAITGGGGDTGPAGSGSGASGASSAAAAAFATVINFPSIQDMVKAQLLQGDKALMNDKPLMPFMQQLCQASMRHFQSLPNGDFFAFYPDYFGEMGHNKPYWYIGDEEILSGGIDLSDENIATHVYAVGDNTWPINDELVNELFSAGTVTIFNAFDTEGAAQPIIDRSTNTRDNLVKGKAPDGTFANLMNHDNAIAFMKRYGARPVETSYPMVRSPIFEMLLAYQNFALAWSRQFLTPFTFTFMPELYPGGKVAFPDHGLQMYIEGVTHSWDTTSGFTTEANLSAPSLMEGHNAQTNPELPPNMVAAMLEPLEKAQSSSPTQRPNHPPVSATALGQALNPHKK